MKKEQKERLPPVREETIRRCIIKLLETGPHSTKDLSVEVKAPEKELYEHLDHIRKTLARGAGTFVLIPPECRACGFVFTKMERLRKPGKCPRCKGESISAPFFSIEPRRESSPGT